MALNKFAQEKRDRKRIGRPPGVRDGKPRITRRENELFRVHKIKEKCAELGLGYEEYPDYRYHYWHISAMINGHNCRLIASTYTERSGGREGLAYNRIVIPKSYLNNYDYVIAVTNPEADTFYVIPIKDLAKLFIGTASLVTYYLPTSSERGERYDGSAVDPWQFLDRWDHLQNEVVAPDLSGKFADDLPPLLFEEPSTPLSLLYKQADAYSKNVADRGGSGVSYRYLIKFKDEATGAEDLFLSGRTFTSVSLMYDDAKAYSTKRGREYRLWYITMTDNRMDMLKIWDFPKGLF